MDVIEYAASLSCGKGNATAYINSVLASWHERNITTIEQAKNHSTVENNQKTTVVTAKSADELNALFAHLNPEDI